MSRPALLAAAGLVVVACTGGDRSSVGPGVSSSDAPAAATTTEPSPTTGPTVSAPATVPVGPESVQPVVPASPLADDVIYMVMTDRFANGDPSNDVGGDELGGGTESDVLRHGFDPTRTGYYHGGDLAGLTSRLDYLDGLGITAIWLTPVLRNRPVQGDGTIDGSSAAYHGYWQLDFTAIDPHLGTEDDFRAFVDAAHGRGMKVIVDVVVNHTADVISYGEQSRRYQATPVVPYRDADGKEFDVRAVAGSPDFPTLDPLVSFPLVPEVDPELADAKRPDFLNDLTNYHHRGSATFPGESVLYGDFAGLDDLFTEKPEVVQGMIDVHADLITRFGVDGFRVDTVKHVNDEFWAEWLPAIREVGGPGFAIFGEVVEPDADALSRYIADVGFPSLIDMRIDDAVTRFAARGAATDDLAQLYRDDDWFADDDSNAHWLVTNVSSHDFGRLGGEIDLASREPLPEEERLARMRLGIAAQFLSRGTPIVYYGDEQGFAGVGGDQAVREDMFPSLTSEYAAVDAIGSDATPADDNFDPTHPLYLTIAELAALRAAHPALRTGPQTVGASGDAPGVIAWTRRGDDGVEYLVALNNSPEPATATAQTLTAAGTFAPVWGDAGRAVTSGSDGRVEMTLPGFGVGVWRADHAADVVEVPDDLAIAFGENATIFGRDLRVELTGALRAPARVAFEQSDDGGATWSLIAVDDAAPWRAFTDPDDAAGPLTVRATVWIDGSPVARVGP